jgi:hypothetical protein
VCECVCMLCICGFTLCLFYKSASFCLVCIRLCCFAMHPARPTLPSLRSDAPTGVVGLPTSEGPSELWGRGAVLLFSSALQPITRTSAGSATGPTDGRGLNLWLGDLNSSSPSHHHYPSEPGMGRCRLPTPIHPPPGEALAPLYVSPAPVLGACRPCSETAIPTAERGPDGSARSPRSIADRCVWTGVMTGQGGRDSPCEKGVVDFHHPAGFIRRKPCQSGSNPPAMGSLAFFFLVVFGVFFSDVYVDRYRYVNCRDVTGAAWHDVRYF